MVAQGPLSGPAVLHPTGDAREEPQGRRAGPALPTSFHQQIGAIDVESDVFPKQLAAWGGDDDRTDQHAFGAGDGRGGRNRSFYA